MMKKRRACRAYLGLLDFCISRDLGMPIVHILTIAVATHGTRMVSQTFYHLSHWLYRCIHSARSVAPLKQNLFICVRALYSHMKEHLC